VVRFERFFEDQFNAYMLLELCANNVSSLSALLLLTRAPAHLSLHSS